MAGCSSSSPSSNASGQDASSSDATTSIDAADSVDAPPSADARPALDAQSPIDASEASTLDAAGIVAQRPYTLHVPAGYDASKPTPLIVMFHGYSVDGPTEELYMDLTAASDAHKFLYAYGSGTIDATGNRFWNATDACCDTNHIGPDDVGYFDAIVADVSSKENVDPKRIFVVGHSNGGFMAHRLACERASTVAGIVSLAGAVYLDASKCNPSEHVSIVELHGDADKTISYTGGMTTEGTYPSTAQTVATWAGKDGCTGPLAATGQTLDMDSTILGAETKVEAYGSCPAGVDVERWTIQGGAHIPGLTHPTWSDAVWTFLSAHAKP